MKKIILILLLTLTLGANTDACKLDVYFGNGVWNDEETANNSKLKLKMFMQQHYPARFSIADDGVTYDFKYAHNITTGTIDDLIETFWQLHETGQVGDFYFAFVTRILDAVNILSNEEENYRERMAAMIATYNVNTENMFSKYQTESFSQKHNVLLVAHSQGNLFGNKMYELLSDDEKKKFQMVTIATPANYVVGGDGDYTTLTYDYAISAIPGSLAGNVAGLGHTFVESYLNENNSESIEKIKAKIVGAVNILDNNSCTKYKYFRWIGFMCPSTQSTELEVDIYGTKDVPFGQISSEELVATDSRVRIALNAQGQCPLQGDDYRTSVSAYDKNGCSAYTFDDTSGNYHSLEYIAGQTYNSFYACSQYNLSVYDTLKDLE